MLNSSPSWVNSLHLTLTFDVIRLRHSIDGKVIGCGVYFLIYNTISDYTRRKQLWSSSQLDFRFPCWSCWVVGAITAAFGRVLNPIAHVPHRKCSNYIAWLKPTPLPKTNKMAFYFSHRSWPMSCKTLCWSLFESNNFEQVKKLHTWRNSCRICWLTDVMTRNEQVYNWHNSF